ncbi:hypothetical protein OSSY52_04890 [Tepiditoga spiralis]|uniref:SoxA A3 domain-containing protein n=1 Tax=Tepiditoga spiralis TaxID=2108365 RepID=A0A7G1G280_9BACT|nr:(2Fe-2S)-binding protein [Tepiditoga spiralis]BBE30348.1 hypothetical protein OSSY52_04890 [Tepiditoga spiralis]
MNDDNIIVCRCEDITMKEIRDAIKEGFTTLEEIKRVLRAGMGPCQGKTCGPIIAREIVKMTGKSMEEVMTQKLRPPFGGITFKEVINDE